MSQTRRSSQPGRRIRSRRWPRTARRCISARGFARSIAARGGRQLSSLVEVSELVPDRLFALRTIEGPLPIDARISVEPSESGTRLRFNVTGEPTGPLRFLQPVMRFALKRQFREHCATLKRVLEQSSRR
jgi:hypothetical protein